MRYYVIAGERSGDLHGSNLMKALKKLDTEAVFRGFGGDYMRDAGADLAVHYEKLAFMGFITLIANYGTIRRMLKFCKEDILQFNPDVVILIDYGGFNRRIARFVKPLGIKTFYYIPPKIWAWYQSRAKEIKANVDRLFVILPFEKEFYKKYDWEVDYVGNPVLDAVKAFQPDANFLKNHDLLADKPIVALLPGSRKMELKRIVPVMAEIVKRYPQFQFAVASVDGLERSLYLSLKQLSIVKFIEDDTYNLLCHAKAAIVTSGTATLETGLLRVPQVCVYKVGSLEFRIAKSLARVEFISLINLIAGKEVIRELLQSEATVEKIAGELDRLMQDDKHRQTILAEYERIYRLLDTGSASDKTAELMVKYLTARPISED